MDETPKPHEIVKRLRILSQQGEQIEYDRKFGAARGGTRAGKSVGWALWLFFKRIQAYPLAAHFVVGADYEQLRRGFFMLLLDLLDSFGWESGVDYLYRDSPSPILHFKRLGPRVRLRSLSAKLVERIRGLSIQTLLLEEPQTWGTKDYTGKRIYDLLIGRLSHSQSSATLYPEMETQCRMSFNPPPEGTWLYTLIEEQWKAEGYRCWRFSVRDNWLLLDRESYVASLEANLDPLRQKSEIDGHWGIGGGGVYYTFNPNIHGHPPEGIPAVDVVDYGQPLMWTHDFNVSEMCSEIVQVFEQPKELDRNAIDGYRYAVPGWQPKVVRFLDEFALRDSSVPQVVEAFLASPWADIAREIQRRTGGPGVELTGDPSGGVGGARSVMASSKSSARRPWTYLRDALAHAGIQARRIGPYYAGPVKDSVFDLNAQLQSGAIDYPLYGATINIAKCKRFVFDLRNLGWDSKGQNLAKKAGEVGDASDAARYVVQVVRRPASGATIAVAKNR